VGESVEEGNVDGESLVRTEGVSVKAGWGDRRLATLLPPNRGGLPRMPWYDSQEGSRDIVCDCRGNCTIDGACSTRSRSFHPQYAQ
jgi:hypothetical protein